MPSVSKAQQHFLGMQYGKKKAGEPTKVDMTKAQLKDFAATKTKGLPAQRRESRRGAKR